MRVLSSRHDTFVFKYLFPLVFAFISGAIVVGNLKLDSGVFPGTIIFVIFSGIFLYMGMPLKEVRLIGGSLFISGYMSEFRVSLGDIQEFTGNSRGHPQRVWIHFCDSAEFGDPVVFMPEQSNRFSFMAQVHPMVDELNQLLQDVKNAT
jgi:hypothetical protein